MGTEQYMNHKIFTVNLSVRFKDIDLMGHVNNAVFSTYFEEGRKEFLKSLLNFVNSEDYNFILAHLQIDFVKPITINDVISLQLWIGKIGNKSFEFKYKLFDRNNESIVYAKGRSVQVSFDYKLNTTIPVPNDFLNKISDYTSNIQGQ